MICHCIQKSCFIISEHMSIIIRHCQSSCTVRSIGFSDGNGTMYTLFPFFTLRQIIIRSFLPYGHSLMMHASDTLPQQCNLPSGPMCQSSPMFIPCVRTGTILPMMPKGGFCLSPFIPCFRAGGTLYAAGSCAYARGIYIIRAHGVYISHARSIYIIRTRCMI